jgi:iron complex outermembrane receptor protein
VAGYQLLGGTTVPDLDRIFPSTMLGEQSWSKPNTFDTFNTSARFDYMIRSSWRAFVEGSYSHSLIDDNVVYPYGTSFDEQGNVNCPGAPDAPYYFFCPDGTYAIYDYRNPGELRIDKLGQAILMGTLKTGRITHDVVFGGAIFVRSVAMPLTSVYDYIGAENIYEPNQAFPIESVEGKPDQAGPRVLYEDNHQPAAVLQDRIHLPGRFQLLAGGRMDSLRDHNFLSTDPQGNTGINTEKRIWLPQYSATWNPISTLMVYGNYSVMLSLGPQAPFWAGGFYLPPYNTRQAEVGAKYEPGRRILLSTALFRMRAPFFYPKIIDEQGDQNFVSEGHETHNGIEVNAQGKAANWLRIDVSGAAIQSTSDDTGTSAFDGKQVINVPHVRTAVFADVEVPRARGLHVMPGWSYTGRKAATRDDTVSVAGYNLFNLGARYNVGGEQGRMTLRLYADNITNKRYWKDTGASLGDTFIHLGAPTTVRLSAHYTF